MTCKHWWRIASPAGTYSKGVCLLCREERDFRNSEEYYGPEHRKQMHIPTAGMKWSEIYRE